MTGVQRGQGTSHPEAREWKPADPKALLSSPSPQPPQVDTPERLCSPMQPLMLEGKMSQQI